MYNFFGEIEKFWFKQIELNIKETTVIFFVVCINNLSHNCVLFNQNFILIPWVEYLEIWIMKKILFQTLLIGWWSTQMNVLNGRDCPSGNQSTVTSATWSRIIWTACWISGAISSPDNVLCCSSWTCRWKFRSELWSSYITQYRKSAS